MPGSPPSWLKVAQSHLRGMDKALTWCCALWGWVPRAHSKHSIPQYCSPVWETTLLGKTCCLLEENWGRILLILWPPLKEADPKATSAAVESGCSPLAMLCASYTAQEKASLVHLIALLLAAPHPHPHPQPPHFGRTLLVPVFKISWMLGEFSSRTVPIHTGSRVCCSSLVKPHTTERLVPSILWWLMVPVDFPGTGSPQAVVLWAFTWECLWGVSGWEETLKSHAEPMAPVLGAWKSPKINPIFSLTVTFHDNCYGKVIPSHNCLVALASSSLPTLKPAQQAPLLQVRGLPGRCQLPF